MHTNALGEETSPYLRQHRDNPVHWQPWSAAAFAAARETDRPVLLSVGYAACHWCHVMAHESFEDPAIAGVMNELFVNIKVDREERPDVDALYQNALALTGQQGGWPLTMFLTPEGEPFWGGTYFPSTPRYGRPGFPDLLRQVAQVYHGDKASVAKNTKALREALESLNRLAAPEAGSPAYGLDLLDRMADRIVASADTEHGGLGGAPKFPQAYAFEFLWRAWLRTADTRHRDAVRTALLHMCQGGLYDHLGGGFARYATDEAWLVPHFEKMLYDNAQLLLLATQVWQADRDPLLAQRVRETADWLLDEMRVEGGGFASSLDADSEGEEGRYYVWDAAEISRLLGEDAALFAEVYDVSPDGNWEGRTILNRLGAGFTLRSDAEEDRLAVLRGHLKQARDARIRPGWDDKVLADWNGLTITALAEAGAVFGEPRWIDAAVEAYRFVCTRMGDGERLWHSHRDGRSQHHGLLDDYAQMARAALRLHELGAAPDALERARAWCALAEADFASPDGAYFQTSRHVDDLLVRQCQAFDNALPSGNGTMVGVLHRLAVHTGEPAYHERALRLAEAFRSTVMQNFFPATTLLNGIEDLLSGTLVVLVAEADDPAVPALRQAVLSVSRPTRVLQQVAPGTGLPATHPAAAAAAHAPAPSVLVCEGQTCSLPLRDPEAVTQHLRRPARTPAGPVS